MPSANIHTVTFSSVWTSAHCLCKTFMTPLSLSSIASSFSPQTSFICQSKQLVEICFRHKFSNALFFLIFIFHNYETYLSVEEKKTNVRIDLACFFPQLHQSDYHLQRFSDVVDMSVHESRLSSFTVYNSLNNSAAL